MSPYRRPAPRSTEALARLGALLTRRLRARVVVNDERLVIRGPREGIAAIGCGLVATVLCAFATFTLLLYERGPARAAAIGLALLGVVFLATTCFMIARPTTRIDRRTGKILSRHLGVEQHASVDDVRAVLIDRSIDEIGIRVQLKEGEVVVMLGSDLDRATCSRAKAFAAALAAWLEVSLIERASPQTRLVLRDTDARLGLDVAGLIANRPAGDGTRVNEIASTAVDTAVMVIQVLDAL